MAMCEGTHFVDCEQPRTGEYKSFDGAGGNQAGFAYIINCLAAEMHDPSWLSVTQAAFDSVRDEHNTVNNNNNTVTGYNSWRAEQFRNKV